MRTVSEALATWLDTHTAGVIRHLVTITPRGGSPVYWTDHGSDITIGGHTFLAGGAGGVPVITWGKRTEVAGTEIGSLEMTLGCGSTATFGGVRLPKAAADRAFDGAVVKVERVFGEADVDTSLGSLHLFEGLVAEARPSSTAVELEIESGLAALNVEIPRKLFRPGCTNILFDTQCGLVKASFTVAGTVAASSTATSIRSGRTEATGYFDLGVLTFDANTTTVALRGVVRAVRSYSNTNGAFTPDRPLPTTPASGDTFTVYPGCPRTLAACQSKFGTDNRVHFRAFPFMPRDGASADGLAVKAIKHLVGSREEFEKDSQDPVPVLYGKRRIRGRLIYQGERAADRVPVQFALCEGEIAGVYNRYAGNVGTAIDAFTGNSTVSVATGTRPTQTAWTALPSGKDLGYPGVALVSFLSSLENGQVPAHEWEVGGRLYNTIGSDGDADPSQIFQDLFPNSDFGAAFPFDIVTDEGLDELHPTESSCETYVEEAGLGLSPYLDQRRSALDVFGEFCEAINCEPLWSGGKAKIIPRADTALGAFSPCTSIRYSFNANSLIGDGDDPVRVRLDPETETFNSCPVVFSERAPAGVSTDPGLAYQDTTEQDPDPVDVALRGERPAADVRLPAICRRDHALRISRIIAQRQVRTRQEVEFSVAWPFCRLEPLDLVTISDDLFPYASQPFQLREVSEDMKTHVLTITAQEWTSGVNFSTTHTTQSSDGGSTTWPPGENEAWLGVIDDRGTNLWPNPTSEIEPSWPGAYGPAWAGRYEAGANAYSGTWVRQVTANETGAQYIASSLISCIPGNTFRFTAQARIGDSGDPYSAWIRIEAIAADKSVIASAESAHITSSTWTRVAADLLIPGDSVFVRAYLMAQGSTFANGTHWFDALDFTRYRTDPDALTTTTSATTRSGSCSRATPVPCTATSNSVSVTPAGGVPPYTYAWTKVSGDTLTITAATAAATTFSTTATPNASFVGVYKCTVTDYNGTTADSDNVTITLEHILTG